MKTCAVPGCQNKYCAKGYCQKHWLRVHKHGDPSVVLPGNRPDPLPAGPRLAARSEWRGDCLIYTAGRTGKNGGHAQMRFNGKNVNVHRIAWILAYGPIPDGMVVRHRCDVPRCVNVAHLELGTIADNNRDRVERGRGRAGVGAANGHARFTADEVREIRRQAAAGRRQARIAEDFGTNSSTISRIVTGRRWASLLDPSRALNKLALPTT